MVRTVPAIPQKSRRKRELTEEEASEPSLKKKKTLRVELTSSTAPHVNYLSGSINHAQASQSLSVNDSECGHSPYSKQACKASSHTGRQTDALDGELEMGNSRPVGLGGNLRIPDPLHLGSVASSTAKAVISLKRGRSTTDGRNSGNVGKGHNPGSLTNREGIFVLQYTRKGL